MKTSGKIAEILQNLRKSERILVRSGAKVWQSCRSRKILKNDYLLAKIGFDTAENEPSKVWTCLPAPSPPLIQLRMKEGKRIPKHPSKQKESSLHLRFSIVFCVTFGSSLKCCKMRPEMNVATAGPVGRSLPRSLPRQSEAHRTSIE